MTLNIDNAVRKYFMHIRENTVIEIWNGYHYVNKYCKKVFELKCIKHDLENIINAEKTLHS